MSNAVIRFLGDSPLRVFVKLTILSIIVGMVMSFFGWRPWDVIDAVVNFFKRIWSLGFAVVYDSLEFLLVGAAIVVPLFLIIRLLSYRSPRA
ncbi:MAG: DUF6460 domain-containing protein [Rhizobiaceae bacterium]